MNCVNLWTMSNIEKLLKGVEVEWKPISKSLVRTQGTSITATQMRVLHKENAPLKIFAGGKTVAFVNFDDIPYKDINREPSIIVKSRGIIEFEYYDKPFTHKKEMWSYHSKNEYINIKFAYYFLKKNEPYFQNIGNRMQMPQISTPDTDNFLIPIPCPDDPEKSLEIQQEIVRILDKFSTLTAELQAELQARKSQYEYYRNQLLTYPMEESDQPSLRSSRSATSIQNSDNPTQPLSTPNPHTGNSVLQPRGKVEWKTLGEIGTLKTGRRFVRTDIQECGVPCFHYGDLYTFYGISTTHTKGYLSRELAKKLRFAQTNDIIIVCAGENDMDIGVGVAWLGEEPAVVHDACCILHHNQNPRYISHFLRTHNYHLQIKKYVKNGKISSLSVSGLEKAIIPIPYPNDIKKSLEEQERIASILDKFNKITTSITEGLPKEIELRQKQYEYYRDMLLTFPTDNIKA